MRLSERVETRDELGSRNEKKKGRPSIDRLRIVVILLYTILSVLQLENLKRFFKENAKNEIILFVLNIFKKYLITVFNIKMYNNTSSQYLKNSSLMDNHY